MDREHQETSSLLAKPAKSTNVSKSNKLVSIGSFLVLLTIAIFSCTAFLKTKNELGAGDLQKLSVDNTVDSITLAISNEYPPVRSLELYPWDYLVEPYRTSMLSVENAEADAYYTWTIESETSGLPVEVSIESEHGPTVSAVFTEAGHFYHVKIQEEGGSNRSFQLKVICKYVRREIRDLNEKDRVEFFDALKIYHTMSTEEGKAKYGDRFMSHKDLTVMHVMEVTADDGTTCTPWHSEYGSFVYSHMGMGLWVEQTLQLIHPAIAMPYWDYIKDSEQYGADFDESLVFTDDYFGAFQPYPHEVLGQWTNLPLSLIESEDELDTEHNSFGIITTWHNNNPSTVLQRSNEICGWKLQRNVLPTCDDIHDMLTANSLDDGWGIALGQIHAGYLHIITGGAWDCAEDFAEIMSEYEGEDEGSKAARQYLEDMLLQVQTTWTTAYYGGYFSDPGICAKGTAFEDCRFTCSNVHVDEMDDLTEAEVYEYLDHFGFLSFLHAKMHYDQDGRWMFLGVDIETDRKLKLHLLKLACVAGSMSPFFSPLAGTDDPLFMPVHTYYQVSWDYLVLTKQPYFSFEWTDISTCYGHRYEDALPEEWYGFLGEIQNETGDLTYSYGDLIKIFNPANALLPYVHDNFNWDYCDTDDFSDQHVKPDKQKVEEELREEAEEYYSYSYDIEFFQPV